MVWILYGFICRFPDYNRNIELCLVALWLLSHQPNWRPHLLPQIGGTRTPDFKRTFPWIAPTRGDESWLKPPTSPKRRRCVLHGFPCVACFFSSMFFSIYFRWLHQRSPKTEFLPKNRQDSTSVLKSAANHLVWWPFRMVSVPKDEWRVMATKTSWLQCRPSDDCPSELKVGFMTKKSLGICCPSPKICATKGDWQLAYIAHCWVTSRDFLPPKRW